MKRQVVYATVSLVLLLGVAGGIWGITAGLGESGAGAQDGIDPEQVVIEIELDMNGSAMWTIDHRVRLDDANATQGFEATEEIIETNRSRLRAPFEQRVHTMATRAQEETGRAMTVQNVSVEAYREQIPQEYGVVSYEFTWHGFAATGEKLRTGDALDGLFIDGQTTLLVSWPEEASLDAVSPEPDERRENSIVWQGPVDFSSGEPDVVLSADSGSFGPDLGWDVSSNDVLITLSLLALVLGTLVTGIVVVVHRRRNGETTPDGMAADAAAAEPDEGESPPAGADADTDDATDTAAVSGPEDPVTDQSAGEGPATGPDSATDAGSVTTGTGPPAESESGETEGPPPELLSNEERVLALLDEQGGRIKQQQIVESFDWSETKTSEVVSDLREADEIEVYRLGRENVLALPDTGIGMDSGSDEEEMEEDDR